MAKPPPAPHEHVLVRTPAGGKGGLCSSCQRPFDDDELRLSEAFVRDDGAWARSHARARTERPRNFDSDYDRVHPDDRMNPDLDARFHHLDCAATHWPYMLRSALTSTVLEVPGRAELEARVEQALSVADLAEADPKTRDEYHRFIGQLRARDDDGLEQVFADWLQSLGDPRGDLIALQRRMASAENNERVGLAPIEKKLIAAHRNRFVPDRLQGDITWRAGFVHRLELSLSSSLEQATLARVFAHPSFRLLRELSTEKLEWWSRVVTVSNLPLPLPSTLRVLELGNDGQARGLGDVVAVVYDLPNLERLMLASSCELDLRSTSLRHLELRCVDAQADRSSELPGASLATFTDRLRRLDFAAVPALETFSLIVKRGLDASLAAVLPALRTASISRLVVRGDLTDRGIELLLDLKGLKTLDLRGCGLRLPTTLSKVATELLTDDPVAEAPQRLKEWRVRHTRRPEWGIGTVVSEGEAGLEVEFAKGGRKEVRNVELLEDVTD